MAESSSAPASAAPLPTAESQGGQAVLMNMAFARPLDNGRFYRWCYVSEDGKREQDLQEGEWLDDQIVPGSVRCDRFERAETPVADARLLAAPASLRREGFEVLEHAGAVPPPDPQDMEPFFRHLSESVRRAMQRSYAREVVAVHVLDHTLRTAGGAGSGQAQSVVLEAHADFTPESGAKRLQSERMQFKLGDERPIAVEDAPLLVNLWQPLDTVYRVALALCDVRSMSSADLVRKTMYFKGRAGEVFNVKRNAAQRWYYYRHMRKDEALIFLTWSPDGTMTAHSAVVDPTDAEDAPPRRSMEVRFAVKFGCEVSAEAARAW